MNNEIMEEVFCGFCKTLNETRTVFCEFEQGEDGLRLACADCDYGECVHTETCQLMKPIKNMVKKIENEK